MYNIITDLDSIFDTRLPILSLLSGLTAEKMIDDGTYYKRKYDTFGIIPNKVFNSFYSKRNKLTLKYSLLTKLIPFINVIIPDILLDQGTDDNLKLYINIYPYNLNIVETDMITKNIKKNLPANIDIELVMMNNTELTPVWIEKNKIGYMFMYHGLKWIEYHMNTCKLFKRPLIGTTIYVPDCFKMDIMNFDNILRTTLIDMEYVNTTIYSADIKPL